MSTIAAPPYQTALERFPRLRQSMLATFDNCALLSKFDIEHRQGWSGHKAGLGSLVHRAIAKCLVHQWDHGEPTIAPETAVDFFDECIRQHDVPMLERGFGDRVVNVPLREQAEGRIIMWTWASYHRVDIHLLAGVEKRLETTIAYPAGVGVDGVVERPVSGALDLLLIDPAAGVAVVRDWKTSWAIPPEGRAEDGLPDGDNISEEGYFQQRLYALLVFHRYPRIQQVVMEETYPRYLSGRATDSRGRPINPVRRATIDRYVLPELEREFSALVERFDRSVEAGVYTPSPGTHCRYCPNKLGCPILPSARDEGAIVSQEDAEKFAARYVWLDATKRWTTRALKNWSAEHGDVSKPANTPAFHGRDVRVRSAKRPMVFGPVVREETRKPTAAEIRDAVARGIDPATLFVTRQVVKFTLHAPDEVHPHVRAAREEEERLLTAEKAQEPAA